MKFAVMMHTNPTHAKALSEEEVSSIEAKHAKLLEELNPDLVLTQGLCDVCAVSLSVVERATVGHTKAPSILSMNPTSLGGMLDAIVEVGEAVGRGVEAHEGVASLRERLARADGLERDHGLPGDTARLQAVLAADRHVVPLMPRAVVD